MLAYSGDIFSLQAWEILKESQDAFLIDVRTQAEWSFVGIPDLNTINKKTIFIEWQSYPAMNLNPNFTKELMKNISSKEVTLLFLCRSGGRSQEAAKVMAKLGYSNCYNIIDGFEGTLDINQHYSNISGWKASNLPWRQI